MAPQLKRDPLGAVGLMDSSSYRSNSLSPDEWAVIWLRHSTHRREEDFWAWDELTWTVVDNPERAWPVIMALVKRASDEQLGAIGAGPIEHLIDDHAPTFIDRIEAAAAAEPKFRDALASIWLNSLYQAPVIVGRLIAASGGVIEPFELDYEKAEREEREGKDGA